MNVEKAPVGEQLKESILVPTVALGKETDGNVIPEQDKPPIKKPAKRDARGYVLATGRRKTSVARVWLKDGKKSIKINGKALDVYFGRAVLRTLSTRPLALLDKVGSMSIVATVAGGGLSGQAGALRHGIARALEKYDPSWREQLKADGLLTRDARKVERKKYGRRKARRSFQFSKR